MTNQSHSKISIHEQGEQQGWRQAAQTYLAQHPQARAIDIGAATGCSEAYALALLSDEVWEIPAESLPEVMAEVRAWERVLVLVRNSDAIAELEVASDSWYVKGDWLNWIESDYNLHLRIANTVTILALVRAGAHGPSYSFNLVNRAGEVFCRLYARTSAAKERLTTFCAAYPQWPK